MNANSTAQTELHSLKPKWGWLLAAGILLMLLGFWVAGYSMLVSVIAVIWFGIMLFASGIVQIFSKVISGQREDCWYHLLFGLLSIVFGLWIIFQPLQAAITLTWVIGVFLAGTGIIQVIYSIGSRLEGWGWTCFNGVISLLLALMIWAHWPASGLWIIGLFVSIHVILMGWSLVMAAMVAKRAK